MFGWPVSLLDETYPLVSDEGGQPAGGIGQAGPDSPYTGIVVYFRVDDIDDALARAVALGGRLVDTSSDQRKSLDWGTNNYCM
jgi:predicted enzyme related to lactoylglutathione lyase